MINVDELEREEAQWNIEKDLIKRKQKIINEKNELSKNKKRTTTTKLLILFLFANCSLIELFTGWAVIQSLKLSAITGLPADFTPLVALIGAVVGEVLGFAIYALKAAKENVAGGLTYETTMLNLQNNSVG